jgi:hypothetical protein
MGRHRTVGVGAELPNWIDRNATLETFGYDPALIAWCSKKMVVAVCEQCLSARRIIMQGAVKVPRCYRCAHGKTLPDGAATNLPLWINRNRTMEVFGYDPVTLHECSSKRVVRTCQRCLTQSHQRFYHALKHHKCLACNGRKLQRDITSADLPQWIDSTATKNIFGYNPGYLGARSRRLVCVVCPLCLKQRAARMALAFSGSGYCNPCARTTRRGRMGPMYGTVAPSSWGCWYTSGDKHVWLRSSWEVAFAYHLDSIGQEWQYESETFPVSYMLNGETIDGTYTPDFKVGNMRYEVKGWWRDIGRAKFQAFCEQYPDKQIIVIDEAKMEQMGLLAITNDILSLIRRKDKTPPIKPQDEAEDFMEEFWGIVAA